MQLYAHKDQIGNTLGTVNPGVLPDDGVIRGFTTVVDRNALGWNTEAYVQVFCHGTIAPDQLRQAWIDIPEVISAATVTGTSKPSRIFAGTPSAIRRSGTSNLNGTTAPAPTKP